MPVTSPGLHARPHAGLTTLQRGFLGLLAFTLVGSIVLRAVHGSSDGSSGGAGAVGSAFVAGGASGAQEPGGLEQWLPYCTEASFFGLIGFALGYATRKIFKVALIAVAIAFVAVQLLVSTGYVAVDWLGVRSVVNQWIFNLKQQETIASFLTNRVPSVGALIAGWFFGFKRG